MTPTVCKKGHIYDAEKMWLGCPYCQGGAVYMDELRPELYDPRADLLRPNFFAPAGLSKEDVKDAIVMPNPLVRPDWDTIWMDFAGALALRSTCSRSSVGCVVVSTDNSTVLGLGYNGGPKGGNNACLSDEPGKCGHLHAEINALLKANYRDAAARKAYITLSPCLNCATALVNFGVEEVIYRDAYRDLSSLSVLTSAGIQVRQFDPKRVPERDLYLNKDRP